MPVRVLIADDHRLFAEALEAVLSSEPRIEVVGRASDGGEAVELARRLEPDLVVLDISMPVLDGFEAADGAGSAAAPAGGADADRLELAGRHRSGAPRRREGLHHEGRDRGQSGRRDPGRCREPLAAAATLLAAMLQVSAVFQVILSVALLTLILMHSGRDAGLGGMGFTPASQGGTHIVERNLTRLTVVVAGDLVPQLRPALQTARLDAATLIVPALVAELVDAQG